MRRIDRCHTATDLANFVVEHASGFDAADTPHALDRLSKRYTDCLSTGCDPATTAAQPAAIHQGAPPALPQPAPPTPPASSARERQHACRILMLPAVQALTRRLHAVLPAVQPAGVARCLRAYSRLRHREQRTLLALCNHAVQTSGRCRPEDCTAIMVALAKMGLRHPELLRHMVQAVLDGLAGFEPCQLAEVVWACGKLRCHPGPVLLGSVLQRVQREATRFSAQELVQVLWALARLDARADCPLTLLAALEAELVVRLPHMRPSELALAAWGFARLRYKAVALLDEMPLHALPQLGRFRDDELCSLLASYALARHYHRVLLDAVAEAAQQRLEGLGPHGLCVVAWAYGHFRHRPAAPEFGRRLALALHAAAPGLSAQGLAMVVKALALLQWRSEALLKQLVGAAEARVSEFKPLELSQLLWGLSTLQCPDTAVYQAVAMRCIVLLQSPQGPYYKRARDPKVLNSIVASCQRGGFAPRMLVDFAESKGVRLCRTHDRAPAPAAAAAPAAAGATAAAAAAAEAAGGGSHLAQAVPAQGLPPDAGSCASAAGAGDGSGRTLAAAVVGEEEELPCAGGPGGGAGGAGAERSVAGAAVSASGQAAALHPAPQPPLRSLLRRQSRQPQ